MENRHEWEVISTEWLYMDCLWRTVVKKNNHLRTVCFPQKVRPGQIINLTQ